MADTDVPANTRWEFRPSAVSPHTNIHAITEAAPGIGMYVTTLMQCDIPPEHFFHWLHIQAAQMQLQLHYHIQPTTQQGNP